MHTFKNGIPYLICIKCRKIYVCKNAERCKYFPLECDYSECSSCNPHNIGTKCDEDKIWSVS